MMKALFLLFSVLATFSAFAQTCDCATDFRFLKTYMEANHPGLNSNGAKNRKTYQSAARVILSKIKKRVPKEDCILYLQQYIRLLKDHHTNINTVVPPIAPITTPAQLDSFSKTAMYKNAPRRVVDSATLVRQLSDKPLDYAEGLYKDYNGNLIAFVKENTRQWPYKGIVMSSVRTFPTGTIRFQLHPLGGNEYWAMVLLPDYQKVYTTVMLENGVLENIGIKKVEAGESTTTMSLYKFNALTDKTNYLRVKSFRAEYYAELDSFYKSIHEAVISKPFLVIDVRGNGGGAESNYFPLLKYLYTNPIYPDVFQFYGTPDIIKRYQESLAVMRADSVRYGKDIIRSTEELIRQLKTSKANTFLPSANQTPIIFTTILPSPQKVIILMDRGCASSCEAFIYNASQSKKVVKMGENTGGFVGFGNTQNYKTPCYGYSFQSTTTKYANLYKYEFTGIPPKVKLQRDNDWIQAAVNHLEAGRF